MFSIDRRHPGRLGKTDQLGRISPVGKAHGSQSVGFLARTGEDYASSARYSCDKPSAL